MAAIGDAVVAIGEGSRSAGDKKALSPIYRYGPIRTSPSLLHACLLLARDLGESSQAVEMPKRTDGEANDADIVQHAKWVVLENTSMSLLI